MSSLTVPWPKLTDDWAATEDAVDVIRIVVSEVRGHLSTLAKTLSTAERERATRFRQLADRERYTIARGTLRRLLSQGLRAEIDAAPATIEIRRSRWGKPRMTGRPALHFNVSHAGDIILIALAAGREVGVDIEHAVPGASVGDLVSVAFGADIQTWWKGLPPGDQHAAFFDLWTRNEALAKALGTGLGGPPIPLTSPPPAAPEVVVINGRPWTLRRLAAAPSYPAAVAAEGTTWTCQTWSYNPEGYN